MNKYRAVQGTLFRNYEIINWSEEKFIQFFELVNYFTVEGKIKVRPENLMAKEQEILKGRHPFLEEVFYRVNCFTTNPDANNGSFYKRFLAMIRTVGGCLKKNPALITDKMRSLIETNPDRLGWMLNHYKVTTTKIGAEIIVSDEREVLEKSNPGIAKNPMEPQLIVMESMLHLANALQIITKDLSKKELKELATKDKVKMALSILDTLNKTRSFKPNIGVQNNIVIHKAGRQELEEALMDMSEDK